MFAAALAIGTGFLFGLFPALHSTRPDLVTALKAQAGQPSGARSAARFRTSLATAQIALSMALLMCGRPLRQEPGNVSRVDLGIKIDNVVTFGISPELNGYDTRARKDILRARSRTSWPRMPGVDRRRRLRECRCSPATTGATTSRSRASSAGPTPTPNRAYNEVGPGYFQTLGVPLIAGREFTRADTLGAPKVAIVNEAFAKKFNLGRDAVGKHMAQGTGDVKLDIEIVGLVQNAKYSEVKHEIPPLFFRPYRQAEQVGAISFYVPRRGRSGAVAPEHSDGHGARSIPTCRSRI